MKPLAKLHDVLFSSTASRIDSRSVSALSDRAFNYEETIRQLNERIQILTKERDSLFHNAKSTNEAVNKLSSAITASETALREATEKCSQVSSRYIELQKSIVTPENILQNTAKQFTKTRFNMFDLPEVFERANGYVTVVKDPSISNLQSLRQESIDYHPYIYLLRQFSLFDSFPADILEKVSLSAYELSRKKGQIILTKGEQGAEIYFISDGMVSIFVGENELSSLQTPVFFGELGVLFKFRRTATVVAKTDVTLIVVTKQKLDEIISGNTYVQALVDEFSANKELWWMQQQYISDQEKFGAEFANDIVRKNIKRLDIFSGAPDNFIDSLAMTITCLVFQENEIIIAKDEESDAMYFLLSGTVQVVGETGVVHAEIQAGSFFGEVGVILNMKRTASIKSKGESRVFELSKSNLDKVILEYPAIKTHLEEAAAERFSLFQARTSKSHDSSVPDQFDLEVSVQSLTKLSLFKGVDQSIIQQLAITMIRKTWASGEHIITCGDKGESMFFLAAGTADVITEFGEVIDDVSGPSAYFGEVAIIEQVPRTATIQCTSECSTYELKKDEVKDVMSKYPEIAAQLKETADFRMQKYLMRNVLA